MKSLTLVCFASAALCTLCRAGPNNQAVIAAMKLSERPNYSWHTTIEVGSGSHVIDGKTNPHGYTWVQMPMNSALARRLDREGEHALEAYFYGKNASVVRAGNGWRTLAELPASRERSEARKTPLVRGSAHTGTFGASTPPPGAMPPFVLNDKPNPRAYSSVRFGVTHPHEELAIIVSCATTFEADATIVTGVLSDTGAALLLVRDEQTDVSPLAAAGEFKLWLRNGCVVKYHLKLEGLLAINRRKVSAHVYSTTVLHDIGSTRVTVPDEVRAKLEK